MKRQLSCRTVNSNGKSRYICDMAAFLGWVHVKIREVERFIPSKRPVTAQDFFLK